MVPSKAKSEQVIEDVAGCGLFQIILGLIILLMVKMAVPYAILFMSFANYNPGWRCMDNVTGSIPANHTDHVMTTYSETTQENGTMNGDVYVIGSCDDYKKCSDVEFNPGTSTIVTEWELVCDRAWIVSLIISIQMLGMLIGSLVCGHLSDLIGRKKILYIGLVGSCISHLLSSFSVGWSMFLAFRFLLGLFCTINLILVLIYLSEFMTRKWRAIILVLPIWYVGTLLMTLSSWVFKDWRKVEFVGFVFCAFSLVPIFWVPESLRWLEAKNQFKQFKKVAWKILHINKKSSSELEHIELTTSGIGSEEEEGKYYSVFDLFRSGYKIITISILFLQFMFSLFYYALNFGTKSMYGDFYLNLFVVNIIPIPFGLLSMVVMRVISRRRHTIAFLGFSSACSIVSIVILLLGNDSAKDFGSTILIAMSKGTLDAAWTGIFARNAEIYPTVVRGIGLGTGSLFARLGAILAPFLIPDNKSVFYIFMIAMSVISIICCLVSLKLPETKGKILKGKFDDD